MDAVEVTHLATKPRCFACNGSNIDSWKTENPFDGGVNIHTRCIDCGAEGESH